MKQNLSNVLAINVQKDLKKKADDKIDKELEKEIKKIFEHYDTDKNGYLDNKELQHYLKKSQYMSGKLSNWQIDKLCQLMDKDGNGNIDEQELSNFLRMIISQSHLMKFHIQDNKNNSYNFLNKPKVPETDVSRDIRITSEIWKIWILFDLNENDALDFDEFKKYINEMAF